MGKFADTEKAVFAVFNTVAWKATSIVTFPDNFVGKAPDNEYIRVSVICGGPGVNIKSVSGVLNIDIFTPSGDGPSRASAIADVLDAYLVGKMLDGTDGKVQCNFSNLTSLGVDRANPALSRALYTISFNYFGV